ncbi:MAG: ABC transporter ATP-binding protein [Lachnospiraceae bacterium]
MADNETAPGTAPGLKAVSLAAGYGRRVVVGDVSFELMPGEVMSLIGPNGAGKSTILKTVAGQLSALSGDVYYLGENSRTLTRNERAKRCAVVLTQRLSPENMTGRDVVETGRYPYTGRLGICRDEDREKADEAIRLFEASDIADRPFDELSDGQRQRLLLARAVCQDTGILVLDEPTSYLDLRYQLEILQTIRRLAMEKRLSVILSLHELDLARQVSDLVACVKDGKITRVGTPEEIFSGGSVAQLFDLPPDTFDGGTGCFYFPGAKTRPRAFVISGGGSGVPVFSKLVRAGIPFATGILMENDIDCPAAVRQAAETVKSPAFQVPGEEQMRRAKELIDSCQEVLAPVMALKTRAPWQEELLLYARDQGKEKPCGV